VYSAPNTNTVVLSLSLFLAFAVSSSLAAAKTLHISPQGHDDASGEMEQPLRTINAAVKQLAPGDTCLIHSGRYEQGITISNLHGTMEQPITIKAAPGAHVLLSGSNKISPNWQLHEGNIFKAKIYSPVRQLFANDHMQVEARWPNLRMDDLWNRESWAKSSKGSRYGKIVDPRLKRKNIDWTGAIAVMNLAHQFLSWSRTVEAHEPGSDTLTYKKNLSGITHYADKEKAWEDDYYYLTGKLEALDSRNEWFYDHDTKMLYFWPPKGMNLSKTSFTTKNRAFAIQIKNSQHIHIEGLDIQAATLAINDSQHCTIENCSFKYPTWSRRISDKEATKEDRVATFLKGDDLTIRKCHFSYGRTAGLIIEGKRNLVENCLLHDFGWDGCLRYPIVRLLSNDESAGEDKCVLRHCTIFNGGNALVNFRGFPGHIVEYNHIYNGGLVGKDIALVCTAMPNSAGSIIRYNWIHGVATEHRFMTNAGMLNGGLGIRGDDQTRGLLVHHNVVWDCARDGIIVKGDHNVIAHNTVFDIGNEKTRGHFINLHIAEEPFKSWRRQYPLLKRQNANSVIANNIAITINGDNKGKPFPYWKNRITNFSHKDAKLANIQEYDFSPLPQSPVVDKGTVIEGITKDFQGSAPDIGAYEYGGEKWKPGITWDPNERESL